MEITIFGTSINIGIAAIMIGLIYIGRKLQILDDIKCTIDKMKHNLKVIGDFLTRTNKDFDPSELKALSPLDNMENTVPTLGVYIRDNYLAKHPEITQ
jgi:hypothetical protein